MTCPHTNWTLDADLRLDGGCIQCWKERYEKAEAAAAELLTYATQLARDMESIVAWKLPPSYHAFMKRDHQPENDYGHGYLPPDKVKVLVEALEFIFGGCYCTCGQPAELCGCAETIANKALDKVKEAQ